MRRAAIVLSFIATIGIAVSFSQADEKKGKLPHVEFDVKDRVVRVECEALNVDAPLEFFCCESGTNEHESVLRSPAKPSDIQIALLAIGLKPGKPISYSEAANRWMPPQGPPLHISVEYQKDGKTLTYPANRWLRSLATKKCPESFTWVYTGSRTEENGRFDADTTGYIVSVCNFDYTLIDIPELKSSANETLEWERNPDLMPKTGTKVWMIIEPVGVKEDKKKEDAAPATAPSADKKPEAPKAETSDKTPPTAVTPAHP